jgi:hypothetical protein
LGQVTIYNEKEEANCGNNMMNKTELVKIIKKLLKTDADLDFLLILTESDLEALLVSIRERCDQWDGDQWVWNQWEGNH